MPTFLIYSDSHIDSVNSGYEITKIFFPDISTAIDSLYKPYVSPLEPKIEPEENETSAPDNAESKDEEVWENSQPEKIEEQPMETEKDSTLIEENAFTKDKAHLESVLVNMNEMKVADLKAELDKLGIKVESRLKKDQLVQRLKEIVQHSLANLTVEKALQEPEPMEQESAGENTDQNKRKEPEDVSVEEYVPEEKKIKTESGEEQQQKAVEEVDPSILNPLNGIKVKGHHLNVVSLHSVLSPHRFDQFEVSNLEGSKFKFKKFPYSSYRLSRNCCVIPLQLTLLVTFTQHWSII